MPSYVRNPVLFLSRAEKKTAGLVSNLAHCSALALDEPLGGGISGRVSLDSPLRSDTFLWLSLPIV